MNQDRPLVLWRFLDGRCGHENQVLGLAEAIAARAPTEFVDLRIAELPRGLTRLVPGSWKFACEYPRPDLLLGAGHGTHLPMLMCRYVVGGRAIVLMKPSLPPALFDLCLVPRHDVLRVCWPGVVRTAGVINRIRPGGTRDQNRGMILVGGPSRHFHWNDREVIRSLCRVMENSSVAWQLVTSRRTPERFLRLWSQLGPKRVEARSAPADSNWLSETLGECGRVWVTSDSMSMIYEALTSGATTGLIPLRARPGSRVAVEVQRLIDQQQVVIPQAPDRAVFPAFTLAGQTEADRCAAEILQRGLLSVESAAAWKPEPDGPMELSVGGQRVRWTPLGRSDAVSGGGSGVNSAPVLLH